MTYWMGFSEPVRMESELIMKYSHVALSCDSRPVVYCDFDGTIALGDVTDVILSRLADKRWLDIESEWETGKITSKECMTRQVALISGGWDAIKNILEEIRLDPTFATFASWCSESGIPLMVVSDGLDKVIEHLLWRDEIPVDGVWANHLNCEEGRVSLTHPAMSGRACESGVCKCRVMAETSNASMCRVVIGDGKSDYCWAQKADLVFAKSKLLDFCFSEGIQCHSFHDFDEIRQTLEKKFFGHHVLAESYQVGQMSYAV